MKIKFFLTFFLLWFHLSLYGIESNVDTFENTKVKIILGKKQEKVLNLGLEFNVATDWKIYWIYPGDAGLAPELSLLNNHNNMSLTPSWPFPEEEHDSGIGLTSRIYKKNIVIPYTIIIKDNVEIPPKLEFLLEYQICKDICIPVSSKLFLNIPEQNYFNKENSKKIKYFENKVPISFSFSKNKIEAIKTKKNEILIKLNEPNYTKLKKNNINVILHNEDFPTLRTSKVKVKKNSIEITLFSDQEIILNNKKTTVFFKMNDSYFFSKINIENLSKKVLFNKKETYIILISAFFAGFILNFMPCVLPVLGIKIYNLLKQSETRNKSIVKLSSFYVSLGIISMFLFFSLAAIIFRLIGINLGWGMQFQSPIFLILLIILLLLFTIITFDLIKINFLQKYIKIDYLESKLFKNNIFISNFFTGILSTLLATPCTAPLVGTAISFALSQSYFLSIIIFLLMGFGKALPYLVFIIKPGLLWYLPKPGTWTKYIKTFVGILLIVSILWLSSLLIGHYSSHKTNSNSINQITSSWEDFNKDRLINYINNNEKIFIDVTAEWCLNCKVNKKLVLDKKEVKDFFAENNIKLIKADWTFPDSNIFEFLQEYNKYGIPFNIYFSETYPNGYIFSEILNKSNLLKILSD